MRGWLVLGVAFALGGCTEFVGTDTPSEDDGSSAGSSSGSPPPGEATSDPGTASDSDTTTTATTSTTGDPTTDPPSTTDPTTEGTSSTSGVGDASGSGEGDSSSGEPPRAMCGDGNEQGEELCDDGDDDELDGCTSNCVPGPTGIEFGPVEETELVGGGSSTGIQNNTDDCPTGEVLVGLAGDLSSEGWLGVIRGRCRAAGLSNEDPPVFETGGPTTDLPARGQFDAGGSWQTQCSGDEAIVAFRGGAGDVMDGIEVRCAEVTTEGDPGAYGLDTAPSDWLPLQGGSGGGPFGPVACPAGSVATGLETDTNSYVIRVRLRCRDLGLDYPL